MEKEIEISVTFSLKEKSAIDKKAAESGMSSEEFAKKTLLKECYKISKDTKKHNKTQNTQTFFE